MNNFLKVYTTLKPVKGYARSAIYDFIKDDYTLVSNEICSFLSVFDRKCIDNLDSAERGLLKVILDNKWGHLCCEQELDFFPDIDYTWKTPFKVNNALLLCDNSSLIEYVINLICGDNMFCKYIAILFEEEFSVEKLNEVIAIANKYQFVSFDLYLPFIPLDESLIFENAINLKSIIFFNSPNEKINPPFYYIKQPVTLNFISPSYFNCNISVFSESQNHNLYYNQKIIIDKTGYIINNLSDRKKMGLFTEKNLTSILFKLKTENLWNISKDAIDVCRVCEFRYMCSDMCRVIKRNDNTYYRSTECEYNPYIAKWNFEDGYVSLTDSGIQISSEQFSIDASTLRIVINNLYGESISGFSSEKSA